MKNAAITLPASVAGFNFSADPELRLPSYPRFPPEILVVPYGQCGLLFEGARGSQVLNGRGARGFIPRLLPQLDGTRSLHSLLNAFPDVGPKAVHDAVALLYSRGLLEDGLPETRDPEPRETYAFLGRYCDVTRVNRNRGEAYARLAAAHVVLAGDPQRRNALRLSLAESGIGQITILDDPHRLALMNDPLPDLMIGVFTGSGDDARTWAQAAWSAGVRLLHVHVGADEVEVGPLFVPGKSASYDCFRTLRARPDGGASADADFWTGVAALHAFHLLSRIGNPSLYNVCHVHRHSPHGALYEEIRIARLPGSAICGLEGRGPAPHEPDGLIWLLHNAANRMPPRSMLSPRDYQMHYAAANIQVTKDVPEPYYGAHPVPLPLGVSLDIAATSGSVPADGRISPEVLAALLRHAVGYQGKDDTKRRIAPSAGNMGSAEIFVVARAVPGIDPGVYHYYAHDHRLDRLGVVLDEELAGALGIAEADLPPLVLIGTASLVKLRQKYNNFAFRFAHLDAGVARLILHEALHALHLRVEEYADVRDKSIAALIRLPTAGTRNLVTYALGIGVPARTGGLESISAHHYVDMLADLTGQGVAPVVPRDPATGVWHPLRDGENGPPLGILLRQRRSIRLFEVLAIPARTLEDIVASAHDATAILTHGGALPVRMRVWLGVTQGCAEYPPGIHCWDENLRKLLPRRAGLTPEQLDAAMLQRMLARAPAVLFITGDFEHAVTRFGARGYRDLFARAGAIAARALLAAEARGLRGCAWGGLAEDGWGDLLDIDQYGDCPLFGVSLGYDASGGAGEL